MSKRIAITISDDLYKNLNLSCKSFSCSKSSFVCMALAEKMKSDAAIANLPGLIKMYNQLNQKSE